MAKADKQQPAAVREVLVRLHSQHVQSADQYEILVNGIRVGYVCHGEGMPINWLDPRVVGGQIKLEAAEKIAILEEARTQLAKLMAERDAEQERIRKLLAGEPT
jgi:hypothetical protein